MFLQDKIRGAHCVAQIFTNFVFPHTHSVDDKLPMDTSKEDVHHSTYYEEGDDREDDVAVTVRLDRRGLPPLGTKERFELEMQERREYERMLEEKRRQQNRYSFAPEILVGPQGDRPSIIERSEMDRLRKMERDQQKELYAQEYMSKHCPFRPNIDRKSASKADEIFSHKQAGRVEDRLIEYGNTKK